MQIDTIIPKGKLFNEDAQTQRDSAAPVGSDVDGIISVSDSKHQWAHNLFYKMIENTWVPQEVDTSVDKKALHGLDEEVREGFNKVIHTLIFNDSAQTNNLASNMMPYVSDGSVKICLARQTFEEALHSVSYDVLVRDVSDEYERIYNFYKEDPYIQKKDKFLADMYESLAKEEATLKDIIMAMVANLILENMMFYSGFVYIWSLGKRLLGSAQMISFIARDEKTHTILFKGMLSNTLRHYDIDPKALVDEVEGLVREAYSAELDWGEYVASHGTMGFSRQTLEHYLGKKANEIMALFTSKKVFPSDSTVLDTLEASYGDPNSIKTNFFEGRPRTYSTKPLKTDDFF